MIGSLCDCGATPHLQLHASYVHVVWRHRWDDRGGKRCRLIQSVLNTRGAENGQ